MARGFFSGFDGQEVTHPAMVSSVSGVSPIAYSTSIKRDHARASLELIVVSGVQKNLSLTTNPPAGGWVYWRCYVRITVAATASRTILGQGPSYNRLNLNPDGSLTYLHSGSVVVCTTSPVLTDTTKWYCVEWRCIPSGGVSVAAVRVDGVVVGSGIISDSSTNGIVFGPQDTATGGYTAYFSDPSCDDADWVGGGGCALLIPISDVTRTGLWTAGAGGTTNLWDAVNNLPPIGTATETNLTQIEHAGGAATALDEYDARCQSYDSLIPAEAVINVCRAVLVVGEDIATGDKLLQHFLGGNPSGINVGPYLVSGGVSGSYAVGTYPVNWWGIGSAYSGTAGWAVNPTVTRSLGPIVGVIRPETASRVASVCFMGVWVEFSTSLISMPDTALAGPVDAFN